MIKFSQKKFVFLIWSKIVRDSRFKEGSRPLLAWRVRSSRLECLLSFRGSDAVVVFKNRSIVEFSDIILLGRGLSLYVLILGRLVFMSATNPEWFAVFTLGFCLHRSLTDWHNKLSAILKNNRSIPTINRHSFFIEFYTSTKSWRGSIFTSVCLCVCASVYLCVRKFLWTKFQPNGCSFR